MDVTRDIRPLSDLTGDAEAFLAALKQSGRPSILTVDGRAELVVLDAALWQEIQQRVEFAQSVLGIRAGLEQADRGEGQEAHAFFADLDHSAAE